MISNTINDAVTISGGDGTFLANRYRIVRQLGAGGMGSVWLAEDMQLDNKRFAIKMLPSVLVSNKRAYRQLKDEALVAMKLTHQNIVTLRAFEENDGNPFLVMDYVDGQTLDDYLAEKGKLSGDETARLLKPIAAALDYAHSKGVAHRDVKPGNVMVAKDGTPYILDFGIAREIQETMTRVTGKLSSGTLLYMSPEQLNGDPPKPAQDIYSFAAMAYECLKGEPPFSRGNIEFQIMNKQPEPLPDGTPLAAGIMAGLAKKPEERPQNCVAVFEGVVSRRGAESRSSQSGISQSPGAPQPGYRSSLEERRDHKGFGGMAPDSALVICPVCGRKNDLKETFRCRECGRDNLCIRHQDEKTFLCADCIANRKAETDRLALEKFKRENGAVKTITLPGGATMEMIYVAPGSFTMGSPESEEGRYADEQQHYVTLTKGFWLGKYPVTQNQWQSVMGRNPSHYNGEAKVYETGMLFWKRVWKTEAFDSANYPVESVSWEDCQKFIRKVNASLNCGARLPTEAEWEYACRAGTSGPYAGAGLDSMGWYADNNSGEGTHPVGQKSPNAWGFYDMHGNVWEWCNDWYGEYPSGCLTDPVGGASGGYRVLRGGSWRSNARYCRSANRGGYDPGYRYGLIGFRLCCSAGPRGQGAEQ